MRITMNNYRELVNKLESIDKKYTLIAEGVTLPGISAALKGYEYDEKVRFSILANIAKKNSLPGLFDPVSGKYINNEGDVDDIDDKVTKQLAAVGLVPQNASLPQAGWFDNEEVRAKGNAATKDMSQRASTCDNQTKIKQLNDLLAKYAELQRKMNSKPPMMENISRTLVESFGYSIYDEGLASAVGKAAVGGAKIGAGAVGKLASKAVPGLGLAYGAYDAYDRAGKGDYLGAAIAGASGIAGLVPGPGTAAMIGLDAINIGRDYANGVYDDPAGKAPPTGKVKPAGKAPGNGAEPNPEVLKIQKELVAKGYPLQLDGVMGPKTQSAIDWEKTNTNKLTNDDKKALADTQSQITKLIGELSCSARPDVQKLLTQATAVVGGASMAPAMNTAQNAVAGSQAALDQQMDALAQAQAKIDAAMSPERREMVRRKATDASDTIRWGKPLGVYEEMLSFRNKLTLIESTVAEATPWGKAIGAAAKYVSSGFGKIKPPGGGGIGKIGKAAGGVDDAGKGLAKTAPISGEYIPAGMASAADVGKATASLDPIQLQKLSTAASASAATSAIEKEAIEKIGIVAWLNANPKKAAALFTAAGLAIGYGLGGSAEPSGKAIDSAAKPPATNPAKKPATKPRGSEELKQTQRMLNALTGSNITVDGVMGPKTQAAYDVWKAGADKQNAELQAIIDRPKTAMESIRRSLDVLTAIK